MTMPAVTIHVDGGCVPNPGAGAWAAVLTCAGRVKELSGTEADTTNNRMELRAVVEGLKALRQPCRVTVVSDSLWVVNTGLGKWRRGANADLWDALDAASAQHLLTFQWVKGHNGDAGNERCHALVSRLLPGQDDFLARVKSKRKG